MKEENTIRKRFYKPYHFFYKVREYPLRHLTEIFQNFHLDDFRQQINLWQNLALSNDQSAYDEGCSREDLIDFIQELHKMIEAFHIISKKSIRQKKNLRVKGLSKQTKNISKVNIPVFLNTEEKARPYTVIKHFSEAFDETYATIELLDLLEAVITYEGNKKAYKGTLILFYMHVHYLIGLAYSMSENKRLIKH